MGAVPAPPEDGGLSAGAITGIVIGVLTALVAVILAGVFVSSRRRTDTRRELFPMAEETGQPRATAAN